jgi:hypothetical protein
MCNHRQGVSCAGPSDTCDLERCAEGDKARHTASHHFQKGTSIDSRITHLRMWAQRWIAPWYMGLGFQQADLKTSSGLNRGCKGSTSHARSALFFATLFSKLARRSKRRGRNDPGLKTESRPGVLRSARSWPQLVANTRAKTTTPLRDPGHGRGENRVMSQHQGQLSCSADAREFRWWKENVPERRSEERAGFWPDAGSVLRSTYSAGELATRSS